MASENLFDIFQASVVGQEELEQILGGYFHGASGLSPDEIVYPGHKTEYALKLRYSNGSLASIEPGPKLTTDDIETIKCKIATDILAAAGTHVGRALLFSAVPVVGYFKYRDVIQILPVPPEAPQHQSFSIMGGHPFLLEFRFPSSPNPMIRMTRRMVRQRELELLLAGLLEYSIRGLGPVRFHWVLQPHDRPDQWSSVCLQEGYTWPGASFEADDFTRAETLPRVTEVDFSTYYRQFGISFNQVFEVPKDLALLLDRFFALPKGDRDRFLRSCFWLRHSHAVHHYSRSAAFTALISAVEALFPDKESSAVCEYCKHPLGPGPTQRFADFVERYAPGGGLSERERKKFYWMRSALSHGGSLLHSDRPEVSFALTPDQIGEWQNATTTSKLVRIVLVNWLSDYSSDAVS